jgi:hypothetical protein
MEKSSIEIIDEVMGEMQMLENAMIKLDDLLFNEEEVGDLIQIQEDLKNMAATMKNLITRAQLDLDDEADGIEDTDDDDLPPLPKDKPTLN